MSLQQTAAPASEPVELGAAKEQCRVLHSDQDSLINQLIRDARAHVEEFTWLQLITATWEWKLDRLVGDLYVPRPPLQSVTSFTYVDQEGNNQTLASTEYTVDTGTTPGRIVTAYSKSWPATRGHINDVTITFKAGFGDNASDVPVDIRRAIMILVKQFYDDPDGMEGTPKAVSDLLSPWRVYDTRVVRCL